MINKHTKHLERQDLSNNAFNEIRDIVFRRSGISLNQDKKILVKTRLYKRLKVLGFDL